ncbi:MAG: response regulator, partial [Oscillospiraceae bacterium]|nr:response regulator [Oscillospiraceae bacterium]
MLGVVIVDDEALVRVDLRSIIDWENEGYTILGEAENGLKGLELILHLHPDIVITDIKMPIMDGLEMIRRAKSEYDGARYVALSSYEEFGLLKSAMNLGVSDYLLKLEFTPEVLLATLEKEKNALFREREGAGLRDISPASRASKELCRILAGMPADEDLPGILSHTEPGIDPGQLCCAAVRFSLPAFRRYDNRTIESAAHGIVKDIAKGYYDGIAFLAGDGLCMFVYTPRTASDAREMGNVIIGMLRQYLNIQSAVGLGTLCGSAANVGLVMNDAILAAQEVFYSGYGRVLHPPQPATENESADTEWMQTLRSALELQNTETLREIFTYLHSLLKKRIARSEAYNLCFTVALLSLSALKGDKDSKGIFAENIYDIIAETDTLEGLQEWMRSFESSLLEIASLACEKTGDERIVMAAKRFIAQNCRAHINLNMVAEHLSISAGYLSQVFKRTASISFVEYVTNAKIEEAKRLLLSGK